MEPNGEDASDTLQLEDVPRVYEPVGTRLLHSGGFDINKDSEVAVGGVITDVDDWATPDWRNVKLEPPRPGSKRAINDNSTSDEQ